MQNANGNGRRQPPFFLLSFIPAVAYWLLETYTSLEVALIGGIALGLLEMILEKKFSGHVHTLSKLNISLVVVLGVISLIAKEGIWFKLQPTLTGVSVAGFFVYKKLRKESLIYQMLTDMKTPPNKMLPPEIYEMMEWHLCIFLIAFAAWMAHVAISTSTANWIFWKTAGFYIAFVPFMLAEMIFIRTKLKARK
jgi:intracellular septation protein